MAVSMNGLRLSLENQTYMSYSQALEEANTSVNHYDQLVERGASQEAIHTAKFYMDSDLAKVKSLGEKLSQVSKESMSMISIANHESPSYSDELVEINPQDVRIISQPKASMPEAVYVTPAPAPITVEARPLENRGCLSWLARVVRYR